MISAGRCARFSPSRRPTPISKRTNASRSCRSDLADTENKIAFARNYYNGAVELYNIKVQSIPGVFLAGLFGFAPAEFFMAEPQAAAVPGSI